MKIVNFYRYELDYDLLRKHVSTFLSENRITNQEFDAWLGYTNLTAQLLSKSSAYGTVDENNGKIRNMRMESFLDMCTEIDQPPAIFFKLVRGKKPNA